MLDKRLWHMSVVAQDHNEKLIFSLLFSQLTSQMGYHIKMFAVVLLITGIYTTAGFNILTTPVKNFTNNDKLFGQTIIKSKIGVFVPSPTNGEVFNCTLEKDCSPVNVNPTELSVKGKKVTQRPITSISSSLSEKEEQLLVCNQVRTKKRASPENFNGLCAHKNQKKEDKINPADLVSEQLKRTAANDPSKASLRKRRQAEQNGGDVDEGEDDEDPGTEIAFVLDGSGSIEREDFTRAKEFMSNVMKNVWTSCFTCNFAVVQFGSDIRTELSLQENDDVAKALDKVKSITQIGNRTKTASALYHVLTEVFVPEKGSKKEASKMIIVLSDGEMSKDQKNLTGVLKMKEMEGVLRFAIGVGPEILGSPKAIKEMIQIAGDAKRFFNVSNYAALETILSNIEKSIINLEGINKGVGFQFELAEAGFSSHLTHEGSMLFGAVGAYDWSGGIILKRTEENTVTFLNATKEEPRFSYLGYSVTSAHLGTKTLYISGAPRYNLTGAVFIFDGTNQDLIEGDQVGSYFGSVLCALDIDNDQNTDYLLVGAPYYHEKVEEGRVLVYKLHQGKFEKEGYVLHGVGKYIFARFGSAIADIGDIDGNKYSDVAIGAPLEADDVTDISGSIYIYNGFKDGLKQQFSQRIAPSDFGMKLVHFGQAVSAMSHSGENKKNYFSVGSDGVVTVFKTVPVIILEPQITVDQAQISLEQQGKDKSSKFEMKLNICFNEQRNKIISDETLNIECQIDVDSDKEEKRLIDNQEKRFIFKLTNDKTCLETRNLEYVGCYDCFTPIKIKVHFTMVPVSDEIPVRVLDAFSPAVSIKEIPFEKECKDPNCKSVISLDSILSTDLITIGSSETLHITFDLRNSGDNSYMTTLTLSYPEILQSKKNEGGQSMGTITAVLTGGINGTEELDSESYVFGIKNALELQLTGIASPNIITIEEGAKKKLSKELQFSFKLLGENKYKAEINVTVTIPKQKQKTDLTITGFEPKNCAQFDDKDNYHIMCTLTDLQDINIKATALIHVEDTHEKITATAELSFDENVFYGKDIRKTEKVEVAIKKLIVVKSTAPIIGGSIGGFVLLIIIIVILVKCGFFRRRRRMERTPSTH
ncbi:LOW QUALITY PROTEIN: integrin alpha-E [Colossoma macropomum]|uniref:LOW QUALITY PROTEIN: integrin alpha-E n=1 Tax=Colossoma macropomum TaxID=42526 RepID=UPI001864080C|nr:LOW QUALITY PROTEIN: integrin alpha-E [Colossoma macropomum]